MNTEHEGTRREFFELLQQLDDPAFVRRARNVKAIERSLLARCEAHYEQLLGFPKMRFAMLAARIDRDWSVLQPFLSDEHEVAQLSQLHEKMRPTLQAVISATRQPRKWAKALQELISSFQRFNQSWQSYLETVDLSELNAARHDYNRYYVIEKASAFQSERIAREGFKELPQFHPEEILQQLPLLRVPTSAPHRR